MSARDDFLGLASVLGLMDILCLGIQIGQWRTNVHTLHCCGSCCVKHHHACEAASVEGRKDDDKMALHVRESANATWRSMESQCAILTHFDFLELF